MAKTLGLPCKPHDITRVCKCLETSRNKKIFRIIFCTDIGYIGLGISTKLHDCLRNIGCYNIVTYEKTPFNYTFNFVRTILSTEYVSNKYRYPFFLLKDKIL